MEIKLRTRGYTLLELLVVLSIMASAVITALGCFTHFNHSNRIDAMEKSLISILDYARLQSLSTQTPILMTGLKGDWKKGIMVCLDAKEHNCAASKKMLLQKRWSATKLELKWCGFQSQAYVLFQPALSQMAANGYFLVKVGRVHKKIIVNRLGSVRLESS